MRRFFLLFLACWFVNQILTLLISVGWFRHVDLRFETFAANQIVPAVQAAVLAWLLSRPDWRIGLSHLRSAARHPLAQVVLVLDAVVLGTAVYAFDHPLVGIARASKGPQVWLATKLVAGGLVSLGCAWRAGWRPWSWVAMGIAMVGLGAEAFWPWDAALMSLVVPWLPTVWRWLLVGIPAFWVIIWIVLRAADDVHGQKASPAWMSGALALFAVAAIITTTSWFLRPYFVEPWGAIARVAVSLSASGILIAAFLRLSERDGS